MSCRGYWIALETVVAEVVLAAAVVVAIDHRKLPARAQAVAVAAGRAG